MRKYRKVKFDGKHIEGEALDHFGTGSRVWMKFSANLDLFSISLAMDLVPGSIGGFMKLADGYGAPGFFPSGYDWSGVRDSSDGATAKMFELARRILTANSGKLGVGLPKKLVAAMTSTYRVDLARDIRETLNLGRTRWQ